MLVAYAALYGSESSCTLTLPPLVNDGASLTAVTLIVNVCGADVSTPPFAVPPLSCATTVTVALPFAFAADVYVSVPLDETAGCTLNSALLLFVAVKVTVCLLSSGVAAEIAVAKLATLCGTASSLTVYYAPFVNDV